MKNTFPSEPGGLENRTRQLNVFLEEHRVKETVSTKVQETPRLVKIANDVVFDTILTRVDGGALQEAVAVLVPYISTFPLEDLARKGSDETKFLNTYRKYREYALAYQQLAEQQLLTLQSTAKIHVDAGLEDPIAIDIPVRTTIRAGAHDVTFTMAPHAPQQVGDSESRKLVIYTDISDKSNPQPQVLSLTESEIQVLNRKVESVESCANSVNSLGDVLKQGANVIGAKFGVKPFKTYVKPVVKVLDKEKVFARVTVDLEEHCVESTIKREFMDTDVIPTSIGNYSAERFATQHMVAGNKLVALATDTILKQGIQGFFELLDSKFNILSGRKEI